MGAEGVRQTEAPCLSIIVASIGPGDDLQSALGDMAHGGSASGVEGILVERESDVVRPERAGVPDTATLPRLLGTALEYARGEIIAITDTRCEFDEGWAATLLRAHESPYPVIGGGGEAR